MKLTSSKLWYNKIIHIIKKKKKTLKDECNPKQNKVKLLNKLITVTQVN